MSLLSDIAEALYGPRWQSELARELSINLRTMQRWAAGEFEPPPSIYANLLRLATERHAALGALLPALRKATTATTR